jgi:DNA mismatch repair protein MutS2
MRFTAGDEVTVLTLKRKGRVIDALGRTYRVSVGAVTVIAAEDELAAAEPATRKKRRIASTAVAGQESTTRDQGPKRVRRVDLHGLSVEQARDAVLSAVNDAILEGEESLEVLHGVGSGRLRDAVRRQLQRLAVVRSFRQHPENHGITVVYL